MYNPTYLKAILIYVRDKQTGYIHIVGTDQHDRLYLDDNGNIQYMNLQNCGTTEGDYEFVLDEQGHNQNNLTYTKEEQEKYGLSNMDDYFDSIDLETYMDLESKKRIQELTEINMRLVTEKQRENAIKINTFIRLDKSSASEIDKQIEQIYLSLQKNIKFVCTNKDLMNSMLDELDYIVYASKLYGGKHVMEELDNRYKNKLMS